MASPLVESESSLPLGVDWSDTAHFTSHCWFTDWLKNAASVPSCAYTLCTISPAIRANTFIQCGSCTILIHREHIAELQRAVDIHNYIPPCRPSFSDGSIEDRSGEHDQHHWSPISACTKPCMGCKRKSMPQVTEKKVHRLKKSDATVSQPSSNLVCLWCSRYCHQWCWENIKNNDDQNKCDYGKFKNIIVRPQWIRRTVGSSVRFHASFTDDINTHDLSFTPLIIFINKLSGGQKGKIIYSQLIRLLNPRQVFLLENDTTVKQAMDIYSSLYNTRICICGGDGTVGWILKILAEIFPSGKNPPVSICPLGTGNDLSRALGWGWNYDPKRLLKMLIQTSNAESIALDQWQIACEPLTGIDPVVDSRNARRCLSCFMEHPKFVYQSDQPSYQNHRTPANTRFTNYISFGLDGAVVLDFHIKRIHDPSRFTSPFVNKLLYLNTARKYFREFILWKTWDLVPYMKLICDGRDLTDSLRHCHTVVLLNIPSYGSGTHPWGRTMADNVATSTTIEEENNRLDQITSGNKSTTAGIPNTGQSTTTFATDQIGGQSMSDRKIEVFGLDAVQMALIHIGFRGRRIAQCNEVRIELIRSMPVHMDGEPFYLPESTAVNVTHARQVLVLRNQDN